MQVNASYVRRHQPMITNHEAASKVLSAAFEASRLLDQSIHHAMASGTPEEVTRYKRAVGKAMAEIMFSILNPVIHEHPDLAPPGWRAERRDF